MVQLHLTVVQNRLITHDLTFTVIGTINGVGRQLSACTAMLALGAPACPTRLLPTAAGAVLHRVPAHNEPGHPGHEAVLGPGRRVLRPVHWLLCNRWDADGPVHHCVHAPCGAPLTGQHFAMNSNMMVVVVAMQAFLEHAPSYGLNDHVPAAAEDESWRASLHLLSLLLLSLYCCTQRAGCCCGLPGQAGLQASVSACWRACTGLPGRVCPWIPSSSRWSRRSARTACARAQ